MSIRSINTGLPDFNETPYIAFPKNPQTIKIGNFVVKEYVSPQEVKTHVEALAEKINFSNFKCALVNLEGGFWLFNELLKIKRIMNINVEMIEYHRPDGGFGANVVTPVPKYLFGEDCLVIDDIKDSAGVLKEIMKPLGQNSVAAVVVDKNVKKLNVSNVLAAMKIDDKWIGGCGMDIGFPKEESVFRDYSGIVVKI